VAAMRIIVVLVVALLTAAFFAYPLLLEDSADECNALELRYADLASHDNSGRLVVSRLYGSSSSEPNGAAFARDHYPLLPSTLGCAIAYWKAAISPPVLSAAAAPEPAPAAETSSATETLPVTGEPKPANRAVTSTIARDITPNGDPISPGPLFTLPLNAVAIRVDVPIGTGAAGRFQLLQGRAVLASCLAEKAIGAAWCKFNLGLRKGNYSIAFTANNTLIGQFPFTVVGR
jgi:hypothetical protein